MLDNEDNQLPLVVFTHFRPGWKEEKKEEKKAWYYVYMTAGGTKFLRIYYGKVRDCLLKKVFGTSPRLNPAILIDMGCLATP